MCHSRKRRVYPWDAPDWDECCPRKDNPKTQVPNTGTWGIQLVDLRETFPGTEGRVRGGNEETPVRYSTCKDSK
jgi:hypothetical protein